MRTVDDQWDITTSVGATALAVAAGRAIESSRDDALVRDPYAQAFVDAAGPVLPDLLRYDEVMAAQATYQGVRSRFFDESLDAAVGNGITQVVLLAAGLDVRAYRLGWTTGVTVYEVDQPAVLAFKDRVLAERGAMPHTTRVPVPVDLRHDWPAALRHSGFDPALPTAWLAEGLLPYLPADAETLLFERVQELSAPGSRIAVEHFADTIARIASDPRFRSLSEKFIGGDITDLFFDGPRGEGPDVWFRERGWSVSEWPAHTLATGYGRPLEGDTAAAMGAVDLLRADLGRAG